MTGNKLVTHAGVTECIPVIITCVMVSCAATRLDRMDFIPLDSCEAKPLPARLRQLGGSSTPAIDLLSYDPQYERAVVHVCG